MKFPKTGKHFSNSLKTGEKHFSNSLKYQDGILYIPVYMTMLV